MIKSIGKDKRDVLILLANGPDPALLFDVQLNEVTSVKAIIWYDASSRGYNFSEALCILENPSLKTTS